MKIAILGYSGSGKSTLAKRLGLQYSLPVLYLDTVQFKAGWQERNREEARRMVAEFMAHDSWVIDGNYAGFYQKERLEQADYIICMTFSRLCCLRRAVRRYFAYRNTVRESAAPGCREKLDLEFIWWILYRGRTQKRRAQYKSILSQYGAKAFELKNQRALDRFLRCIC